MKEQNNQCNELLSLMKVLDEKIIHMEMNVPPQVIYNYHHAQNELSNVLQEIFTCNGTTLPEKTMQTIENGIEECESPVKDCKKVLFSTRETYPTIPLITKNEFTDIPKYIIGRQPLEAVNGLIDTINQILKAKYTFLALGKAHARKHGNLTLFLHYKRLDSDICTDKEQIYFFTAEDYEKHTKSKLNKIKLNLMTVLRHCKRLREHRVKNDLRYVVITE
ncbi:Spindle and kinetochore-associated protein 1 [Dufourea novaeangliae]|uniref:SKA complex subunit 1 n=2 Tax=Dufourea novaeangliae TaxID=178035 RepID=A0A154PAF3_DUFNO|nr:Spindle and kinetochore-associated protein 1 [Dufourea novaeangliae]